MRYSKRRLDSSANERCREEVIADQVPSYLLGVLVGLWRLITYFTNLTAGAIFVGAEFDRIVKRCDTLENSD